MRQTRIQIAKSDIVAYFNAQRPRIFTKIALEQILNEQRSFWRLAQRTTTQEFIDYLVKTSNLSEIAFNFPARIDLRYVWNNAPLLEVVASLRPNAYVCHYTAMKAHGLTDQVPKSIYLNHEQAGRSATGTQLRQTAIDSAFARPQRTSNNVAPFGEYRVCLLSGQNTGNAGVTKQDVPDVYSDSNAQVRITSLERTLIDIAVRPAYAGGVSEVLNAYRNAAGRVSVNKIGALLKEIGYVYPYAQSIGFYLDRTGLFSTSAVNILREFPQENDFYLTHQMGEMEYIPSWRLYVPKGF